MPVVPAAPVHFTEAIDFLRNKTQLPTRAWTDIWQGQHSRAFVVAGAQKAALVSDFHEAVTKAIAEGQTIAQFREQFDAIVARHGWSYNGGRNWRSNVIFQTNLRTAYSAGRWQQAQRTQRRRPYMRYVALLDERTRPEHRAWHDTILPIDHEWWQTHNPPNGWNCRCTTHTVSEDDLRRNGWAVSKIPPKVETEIRKLNTPDGAVSIEVPKGIDPGFAYNPGEAAFGRTPEMVKLEAHGDNWDQLIAPGAPVHALEDLPAVPPGVDLAPRIKGGRDELLGALRRAIGGDEVVFDDPAGGNVLVNASVVEHLLESENRLAEGRERYWPLIRSMIEEPQEIWIGFARNEKSGRVALRRRYVKVMALERDQPLLFVADQEGGYWQGLTFFAMQGRRLPKVRSGYLVYREEGGGSGSRPYQGGLATFRRL